MTFDQFIKKVLEDADFRKALEEDPEAALADADLEHAAEVITALKGVSWDSLRAVAKHFEGGSTLRTAFT